MGRQELVAGRRRRRHRHRRVRLDAAVRRPPAGDLAGLGARHGHLVTVGSRAPIAFLGGFVMLLGARIAGGCTSGHGISGIAQLSVGSTLAVAAMFAGGILTAMLLRRA